MHETTDIAEYYMRVLTTGARIGPRGSETIEVLNSNMAFEAWEWFIDSNSMPLRYTYVVNELKWYLMGKRDDHSIMEHASMWENLVDDNGLIQSNYGHYFNEQIDSVVEILRVDPHSRRAVICINQPEHNYAGAPDVPCTMYMGFTIRNGDLNINVHMRSQDMVYGLRNDLPAFQMFKLMVATRMDLPPGRLHLSVDSLHIYERHYGKVAVASSIGGLDLLPGPVTAEQFEAFLNAY